MVTPAACGEMLLLRERVAVLAAAAGRENISMTVPATCTCLPMVSIHVQNVFLFLSVMGRHARGRGNRREYLAQS